MKLRQAKKVLFSRRWHNRCNKLRPPRFNEKTGYWEQPSFHDIPIPTYQKARVRYITAANKFHRRHGYCFDDKTKGK